MRKIIPIVLLLLLLGCTSLSQQDAEGIALDFIKENVKFFARNETQDVVGLESFFVESTNSYKEGKEWVVAMHISALRGNETKQNDVVIRIGKSKKVTRFNGQEVQKN